MDTSARSETFTVRSSRIGSTAWRETAKRIDERLTWAYSESRGGSVEPNSSRETSSRTRNGWLASLRMSETRCWRVWIAPRTTNSSVYSVIGTDRRGSSKVMHEVYGRSGGRGSHETHPGRPAPPRKPVLRPRLGVGSAHPA